MTKSPRIRRTSFASCLGCLIVLSLTAGCAPGDGQGLDQDGNLPTESSAVPGAAPGGGGGPGASGNPNATLAWVQGNVFGGVCKTCHTGNAIFNINWDTQANTCSNVGRASNEMNGSGNPPTPVLKEIDRGNPGTSYVIWKVNGAGPNGEPLAPQSARMPFGLPALSPDTIQNMSDWIADGAPGC